MKRDDEHSEAIAELIIDGMIDGGIISEESRESAEVVVKDSIVQSKARGESWHVGDAALDAQHSRDLATIIVDALALPMGQRDEARAIAFEKIEVRKCLGDRGAMPTCRPR